MNRSYRNTSISAHQRRRRESSKKSVNGDRESRHMQKEASGREKLANFEEMKRYTKPSARDMIGRVTKRRGIQTVHSAVSFTSS